MIVYKHLKSGMLYEVIEEQVCNCTNGENDGEEMVLYVRYKRFKGDSVFVRNKKEFNERFIMHFIDGNKRTAEF